MPGSSPGERWAHHSSRSEIFASEKRESRREKASLAPSLAWRGPEAKREAKEEAASLYIHVRDESNKIPCTQFQAKHVPNTRAETACDKVPH